MEPPNRVRHEASSPRPCVGSPPETLRNGVRRGLAAEVRPELDQINRQMMRHFQSPAGMPRMRREDVAALVDKRFSTALSARQLPRLHQHAAHSCTRHSLGHAGADCFDCCEQRCAVAHVQQYAADIGFVVDRPCKNFHRYRVIKGKLRWARDFGIERHRWRCTVPEYLESIDLAQT